MEQQSRLLRLPRELRDKVLFYACEGRVFKVVAEDIKISKWPPAPRPGLRFDPKLLLINHQICEEAKAATIAAYTTNVFHFDSPAVLKDFASVSCRRNLQAIRQLQVELTTLRDHDFVLRCWFDALADVLADQFLGLEDLYAYRKPTIYRPGIRPSTYHHQQPVNHTQPSSTTRPSTYRASFCEIITKPNS